VARGGEEKRLANGGEKREKIVALQWKERGSTFSTQRRKRGRPLAGRGGVSSLEFGEGEGDDNHRGEETLVLPKLVTEEESALT